MREVQTNIYCDACEDRGKRTKVDPELAGVTINIGSGPHTLDLCKNDIKTYLAPLQALINDYGVKVSPNGTKPKESRPSHRSDEDGWAPDCPVCGKRVRGTRTGTVNHLVALHGMDRVEASRTVPPKTDAVECPECGFLAQHGTGISMHVSTQHGEEAWQRIKPTLKVG